MTISSPVTLPTVNVPAEIEILPNSIVGFQASPFTGEQTLYVHQGEFWRMNVSLPPMIRADAEEWVAFLLALNGQEHTFLMGDPVGRTARGSWATDSVLVKGASQTGKVLLVDGLTALATYKKGDWFQLGSGTSTRLHKLVLDGAADGSGNGSLDFWPRLRAAPADNAPLTIASARGQWRLASNERRWSIREAQIYGIQFEAIEALEA